MAKNPRTPAEPATLSISRITGGDCPVRLTIRSGNAKSGFRLTVEMTPEQFGLAVTGMSDVPVEAWLKIQHPISAEE